MTKKTHYIPALKYDWLTKLFDPVMKLTMREEIFKNALLIQANIRNNDTVLDFGCGTATLTLMAKKLVPKATVYGVDVDPKVLEIAKNKVRNSGYEVYLNEYDAVTLPFKNDTFDKVVTSLVFHHLTRSQKACALKEIHRVLESNGELHIADFGKSQNIFMRIMFFIIQLFDGLKNTTDNVKGMVPLLIQNAGFGGVTETKRTMTMFGTLSLYKAVKTSPKL